MITKLNLDAPLITTDGRKVRVLATVNNRDELSLHDFPIVIAVQRDTKNTNTYEDVRLMGLQGLVQGYGSFTVINTLRKVWVNIYEPTWRPSLKGACHFHQTEASAIENGRPNIGYITTVSISIPLNVIRF